MWRKEVHHFVKNGEVKLKPGLFAGRSVLDLLRPLAVDNRMDHQPGKCPQADEMDVLYITCLFAAYKKFCENG
jgi:hypothetical protein